MNGSGSGSNGQGQAGGVDGTTRVVYFDGQRLEADDLNSAADQMRQLRWLHNRSLHGPGVALGFAATGNAGDRQVTVQPGYAVDCLGRELVLTTATTLPIPARSGNAQGQPVSFALVAAYPDDSQLAVIQTRATDCGGTSAPSASRNAPRSTGASRRSPTRRSSWRWHPSRTASSPRRWPSTRPAAPGRSPRLTSQPARPPRARPCGRTGSSRRRRASRS